MAVSFHATLQPYLFMQPCGRFFSCNLATFLSFRAQYGVAAALVIAECAANCVIVSVIISHGGQCQLLKYYLDGIMNQLEEKNTELRYIMKVNILLPQNNVLFTEYITVTYRQVSGCLGVSFQGCCCD